jgi:hypothetical protein
MRTGRERIMAKLAAVAAGVVVVGIIAFRQDIARYIRIKKISAGQGHPEMVPAEGRKAYPQAEHPTLSTKY